MSALPFRQNPRKGQRDVIELAEDLTRRRLCAQLPTGYGKTFTAACVFSTLQRQGRVDRLLYLVPSSGQLDQFVQDGSADLEAASLLGGLYVCDVAFHGAAQAERQHRMGTHQVFACTIQGLSSAGIGATIRSLMQAGRWMICVDEYHHYGIEKTWGRAVIELERLPSCEFLLALSATPYRQDDDSAFGKPDVTITYRQAVSEKAVKPLECHGYTYRVDAIDNGDVVSYTTQELADKAGDLSPEALERVFRVMRWSPKYISPLVDVPISRMQRNRIVSGYKLQALIGAFCCSHAQLVCEQVRAMFPELTVDWVGTGTNGRSDAENRRVLANFCPPKRDDGKRHQSDIKLDVLVHVGMAGEGLDTVFVSEVIHLNPANRNNSNDQENGRAARYLPDVTGYINCETGTDYAKDFLGGLIELAFDTAPGEKPDEEAEEPKDQDGQLELPLLPDQPTIQIVDCELIEINTGEVARMAQALSEVSGQPLDSPEVQEKAVELYRRMRRQEAERFNDRAVVEQWCEAVSGALSVVTRRTAQLMTTPGVRMDKGLIGDIKKRINTKKKRVLGAVDRDVENLRRHYGWLKSLENQLIQEGVPSWLQ
jgi:superfamily II DNA or RNA helicase